MRYIFFCLLSIIVYQTSSAQEASIVLPSEPDWNLLREGDSITFKVFVQNSDTDWDISVIGERSLSYTIDSTGIFSWTPSYDLVDRVNEFKTFSFIFEATQGSEGKLRQEVDFTVFHVNRPPVVDELPTFYVKQNNPNEINLNQLNQIRDADGDPMIFKPILSEMPEGSSLSELGIFYWEPSRNQFRSLTSESIQVKFIVQDQPYKSETVALLNIQPTQMDLPPEIVMVPNDSIIIIKEDEFLNLNFYLSDPNGDDNIKDFGYVANNRKIPSDLVQRNASTQVEFRWMPGYEFIEEVDGAEDVEIVFFVLDQSNKRSERKLIVRVKDTEDIEKLDQRLFSKYKITLIESMNLIAQLKENQRELTKQLQKARKGKKNRAITNASLGAITGVGPVFIEAPTKNYVTGIGGTAVMTMGTLEATDVVGKDQEDILEKMKISIDIQNQLQTLGDKFARQFALRTARREKEFFVEIDKIRTQLNDKKLILLELDASWQNPERPTDKNIRKTFPDYINEGFE
jgi:hypothetical protein